MTNPRKESQVKCAVCGHEAFFLGDHVLTAHNLSVDEYAKAHPGNPIASEDLLTAYLASKAQDPKRIGPPALTDLTTVIGGFSFTVNHDVAASACLPLPNEYRFPALGKLNKDIQHACVALKKGRSIMAWGLPGTGKDALFSAWSYLTRTPGEIYSVGPDTDIQSWFFSQSFNKDGTSWEDGQLLKNCRDGHVTETGRRVPMIIVFSDFDRASKGQAEAIRLLMDSIEGRIKGPRGVTYPVLPGTRFVFTANSIGAGDTRGRCISSNPIDASILDRIERVVNFHNMEWLDEVEVLKAKFPLVVQRAPDLLVTMGKITTLLRELIDKDELYCEFSHRALCAIVGHAQDILECSGGKIPTALIKKALRIWVDKLPSADVRDTVKTNIDPLLTGGTVDEGDTTHITTGTETLAPNF